VGKLTYCKDLYVTDPNYVQQAKDNCQDNSYTKGSVWGTSCDLSIMCGGCILNLGTNGEAGCDITYYSTSCDTNKGACVAGGKWIDL
jgi:hypothetical protein